MRLARLRRPLFGLGLACLIWVGLEAASMLIVRFPQHRDPVAARMIPIWTVSFVYDELLFWRLKPGSSALYRPKLAGGEQLEVPILIQINSDGLRDRRITPKRRNEFRVLSLGESSTFGDLVAAKDSYTEILERELGPVNGKKPNVINAGVPGYTLFQGWLYLRELGVDLEPDAVLLYFGFNDFLPVAYRERRDTRPTELAVALDDWSLYEARQMPLARASAWLHEYSNIYRGLTAARQISQRRGELQKLEGVPRVPEARRAELLREIRDLCDERGIHLTIIAPWYSKFRRHVRLLRDFARREGVTIVDVPRLEYGRKHSGPEYFFDGVHPTPAGHRRIAGHVQAVVAPVWETFDRERDRTTEIQRNRK